MASATVQEPTLLESIHRIVDLLHPGEHHSEANPDAGRLIAVRQLTKSFGSIPVLTLANEHPTPMCEQVGGRRRLRPR